MISSVFFNGILLGLTNETGKDSVARLRKQTRVAIDVWGDFVTAGGDFHGRQRGVP